MSINLPLHPTLCHPLTGDPLRALYVDKTGRARYPIMGAAEGDDPTADPPKADPPPADPPKTDPPADKGFPENTPVAQMTVAQQAAYHLHQSRKHEARATEYREAVGGKSAEEVKAALAEAEKLRQQSLSDQERAIEDAKREARTATANEFGPKAVRTAFELALRDLSDEDRAEFIGDLDLSKFLTDSGDVDTAKVLRRAEKIAPTGKGTGTGRQSFDFGGGRGQDNPPRGGSVAAVMAERAAARAAKTHPNP